MLGAPVQSGISTPPLEPLTILYDYAGGSNLAYKGWAKSNQITPVNLGSVASFSAASPGVLTFTNAHGLNYDATGAKATATPAIAISGGTGNWAAANGVWVFQATSTTAGNIASVITGSLTKLNTTGFGAVTGTLVVYTLSPQTSAPIWSIQAYIYNASNAIEWSGWPVNVAGAG